MNKKSYMFMLDAVIAIVMLVIGIAIIFYSFYHDSRPIYITDQLSDDIVGVLSYTQISDLCINLNDPVTCKCPRYSNLTLIVCNDSLKNTNTDLLSMMSEVIETGQSNSSTVKNTIHEIFVTKNVIDEKRFGFALLYWSPSMAAALELYNTECYPDDSAC
jgi:hypothetical protein